MTKIGVHVTTIDEWKSVLDVWFEQGYKWPINEKEYLEDLFDCGGRFLFLDNYIAYNRTNFNSKPYIEYSEFMGK